MTASEIAVKLDLISKLTAGEVDGYEAEARKRGLFDGELAALIERRAVLKLKPLKR